MDMSCQAATHPLKWPRCPERRSESRRSVRVAARISGTGKEYIYMAEFVRGALDIPFTDGRTLLFRLGFVTLASGLLC